MTMSQNLIAIKGEFLSHQRLVSMENIRSFNKPFLSGADHKPGAVLGIRGQVIAMEMIVHQP